MARSFVAGDYAGITSKNLDLYYGYECWDENGEWCFSARVGGSEVMKIPQSKLKVSDKFDCVSCLLAGIGQLFDKYGATEIQNATELHGNNVHCRRDANAAAKRGW